MLASNSAAAGSSIAHTLEQLGVDPKLGLTSSEAQSRLTKYGPNALREEKKSALAVLAGYFWGPIPWMIEAAALMALLVRDWGDFAIITSLVLTPRVRSWLGCRHCQARSNLGSFPVAEHQEPIRHRGCSRIDGGREPGWAGRHGARFARHFRDCRIEYITISLQRTTASAAGAISQRGRRARADS